MTIPQFQLFQLDGTVERVCVTKSPRSDGNLSYYVCMEDIQDVFPNARRFKLDGNPIQFLKDSNGTRFKPLRIDFYPDKTLEVILDTTGPATFMTVAHYTNTLQSQSFQGFPSYSETLNTPIDSRAIFSALNDIKTSSKLEQDQSKKHGTQKNVENKELNQAKDSATKVQSNTKAILNQNIELHKYAIPRLFIILPVDQSKWNRLRILDNKFRLFFLCECGDQKKEANEDSQNHVHIAEHEGYEIKDPIDFYRLYGKRILLLLLHLQDAAKLRTDLSNQYIRQLPHLEIDLSITFLKALSIDIPIFEHINTTDDYDELEGTDFQKLYKYLRIDIDHWSYGNLYRIGNEEGNARWVCLDHHSSMHKENEQREFENVVEANGGSYNHHLGKVIIKPNPGTFVKEFYDFLARADHIYELNIKISWDLTKADLEYFKKSLMKSRISILRLDLSEIPLNSVSILSKYYSPITQCGIITGITEIKSLRKIQIVLPSHLIDYSNLQPKKSQHLHVLSYEQTPQPMGIREIISLTKGLKLGRFLSILNLTKNSIGSKGAIALSEALKTNASLTSLNLWRNSIGNEGAIALSEALKINASLVTLSLSDNSIGNEGAIALSEALKTNTSLETLDLWRNSIEKEGAIALSEALTTNASLVSLNLSENSIGKEGAIALSETLKINASLASLNLSENLIGKEGAIALSEALKTNASLGNLNLDGSSIGKEGGIALSEALKINASLASLSLWGNLIGNEGAIALSEALKTNTSLETLDLWGNSIGKEGAIALSEALKTNASLTSLNLWRNSIGNEGAIALSEALKTNASLVTLSLSRNSIGKEGGIALSEALKTNTSLASLDLNSNSIGNEGAIALSEALKTNTSLETLDLWRNSIEKEGAIALSEALTTNASLVSLNLKENSIGKEGAIALSEALKASSSLKNLRM